jgi:predicted ATPase
MENMTLASKNYVITGGPCTGKTEVINALRKDGFIIVPEAARLVKWSNKRFGGPLPEDNFDAFEDDVLQMQEKINARRPGVVRFHDRAYCDDIAYYDFNRRAPSPFLLSIAKHYHFDKIFFLSQLGFYKQDKYRPETEAEAALLHKMTRTAYLSQGYEIIDIPLVPVWERIRIIKDYIADDLNMLGLVWGVCERELKQLKK